MIHPKKGRAIMTHGSETIATGAIIKVFDWIWQNFGKDITADFFKRFLKVNNFN
jgi:hypothetical protein